MRARWWLVRVNVGGSMTWSVFVRARGELRAVKAARRRALKSMGIEPPPPTRVKMMPPVNRVPYHPKPWWSMR